jgi:glutathione S-transferase
MTQLRIFSYLPNPRIWKATIAARLCGVEIELRGSAPQELQNWLWDFDARPLSEVEPQAAEKAERIGRVGFKGGRLFKTDAFLQAHPFGTVPAAFSPDGRIGIFESNSIMRAVARLGHERFALYGRDPYEASRIDGFLDTSLVFARDAQIYLFALRESAIPPDSYARAKEAFATYIAGIEQALQPDRMFLVGDDVTLADICFVAELGLFSNERTRHQALEKSGLEPILGDAQLAQFPRAMAHFTRLADHPAFAPDVRPYLAKLSSGSKIGGGGAGDDPGSHP